MSDPRINSLSDYGILNLEACDPGLRERVVSAVREKRQQDKPFTEDQLNEIVTYITQLEDALLRYRCGNKSSAEILELVKCSTGLDINARAQELDAMTAEDS